ncbi:MAG TPA: c-type cytochrome [Burkholderiaceae bacterium]|nr:c-type cytochrome [Burkholderiaceae bacterium]
MKASRTPLGFSALTTGALAVSIALFLPVAQASPTLSEKDQEILQLLADMVPDAPEPAADDYVHIPPTMEDLEKSSLHPKLKETIERGHDLFMNTQQLRGKNVFNNMNCVSCHTGEGRLPHSGPVWPAAVTLPDYRPKNDHVNSLEERIAGCFTYSMNGKPPAYGSDDMLALAAYHQWLATGVPLYQPGDTLYGRGYPRLDEPEQEPDVLRGKKVYKAQCALCHGDDGGGKVERGEPVFPALWGDDSYNWGAGIARVFTLASFVQHNMPWGKPGSLSIQESWDVAQYINSHERPQDPRYTGDAKETRERYLDTFHKHTLYGTEFDGRILGDHDNVGHKDFLKPDVLRPRDFSKK